MDDHKYIERVERIFREGTITASEAADLLYSRELRAQAYAQVFTLKELRDLWVENCTDIENLAAWDDEIWDAWAIKNRELLEELGMSR